MLSARDVKDHASEIVSRLYANIPSGVGSRRKDLRLSRRELATVLGRGASWAVGRGYGDQNDLESIESRGVIDGADPDVVSEKAFERGKDQLGTLGSGNHFVEIGYVDEIYDRDAAEIFGLSEDQATIMIHTGSRGLGYQVCDDYLREMIKASRKYMIELTDRQLCCAPVRSDEGRRYLGAMAAAANYAFANRQMITHWVRESMEEVFALGAGKLGLSVLYDVSHNIAKLEKHTVEGREKELCVHRKGATRAFGPGHPDLPGRYRNVGQPILIPGDMGRASYVLCGTERAMAETFGSTCHGAGRLMSRTEAVRASKGRSVTEEMAARGVTVMAASRGTLGEEMPEAYKDVSKVVQVVHNAGIGRLVARIVPVGVIKG